MQDKARLYTLKKCPKVGPIRVQTLSMMDFDAGASANLRLKRYLREHVALALPR